MFNFFRKKAPPPLSSPPLPAPKNAEPPAELTDEQKKLVTRELERMGEGDGSSLDASIGLLHLTGDPIYLKGILQFLENAEISLLLKQENGATDYLILTHENLRYLPIFTRPEHVKAVAAKYQQYKNIGSVNSKAFFSTLEPGMGLWINPGHSVFTYIMASTMFTSYVAMLSKKR